MVNWAPRSGLTISLLLLASACSGGGGGGGDRVDASMDPNDPDGGGDPSGDAGACAGFECATGQLCELTGGAPTCAGSCDELTCAPGLRCEVADNVGRCVPACEPDCGPGQRCERDDSGQNHCVDNTCDDLDCGALEACKPASDGHGNVCADNRCESDVNCEADQHCDGTICMGDACEPGTRTCQGSVVRECTPNGAGDMQRVACVSEPGLESACVDGANGAACSCRDDWDCPAYTECVQGSCQGTGRAPTCFLEPLPFADLLPQPKPGFPWGGDDADGYNGGALVHGTPIRSRDAKPHVLTPDVPRPFARYAQVSAVPVVANLDDDNGDGLIDELDVPEIVFPAFCDTNYQRYGMLRAVHGGGAKAGQDYFAVCGGELWKEGETPIPGEAECPCNAGDLEPNGGVAVGDLDGDGVPEIITVGHAASDSNNRLVIFRNTGDLISEATLPSGTFAGGNPAVTIANLDHAGFAELVIGATVAYLKQDDQGRLVLDRFLFAPAGGKQGVNNGQGAVSCVAELKGGGNMEIVAGGTMYRVPSPVECDPAPSDADGVAFCANQLIIEWNANVEGFCAVADVLGAPEEGESEGRADLDHPLDGLPEVVLISDGNLSVFDGETGTLRYTRDLPVKEGEPALVEDGGPPNIDDFDGDGFPEVGTAFATFYVMHDFQTPTAACPAWPNDLDGDPATPVEGQAGNPLRTPPSLSCLDDADCDDPQFACGKDGQCVCLHNGWRSKTQDASSRVTGSSVFDFNGDGAAEVVYNDECFFRIYEGKTGKVYQRLDSQSPTRIEYPVVADVDSDGNAEIVFSGSNARSESCGRPDGSMLNGINVIGDPTDRWVSARRIWNQHAYHVTNVLESGAVPAQEVPSWKTYGGRSYNTYRSNLPPIGNVAPDLSVLGLQVSSPGVTCGGALSNEIQIVALVANLGDLRTGPEVLVRFVDEDGAELGVAPVGVSLEPSAETFVSVTYVAATPEDLPARVRAQVDYQLPDPSVPDLSGSVRECREDNNEREITVQAESAMPELRVEIESVGAECTARTVRVRVFNDSDLAVGSVDVKLYAGNPASGGSVLDTLRFEELGAQGEQSREVVVDVGDRLVNVHAAVDPDRRIAECDDSNNLASVSVDCRIVIF